MVKAKKVSKMKMLTGMFLSNRDMSKKIICINMDDLMNSPALRKILKAS